MFLTKQEKSALLFLLAVVFSANAVRLCLRLFPSTTRYLHIIESEKAYPKIDINKANWSELESVPYIGKTLARRIIEQRKDKGPFRKKEELRDVRGINAKVYQKIERYLRVGS